MKRVLRKLLVIPVLYLVFIPVYLTIASNSKICHGMVIELKDSSDYHFVTKRQLLNLAYNGLGGQINGKPVKELPVPQIEKNLSVLKELKAAEVYTTIDGMVHVFADQRKPVMRVMPDDGGDFFVDEDGYVFRKRNLYNPRLHIISGNVNISQAMLNGVSVLDTSIKRSVLKDVFPFVSYIIDDDFWSAQIDQISIDNDDEIDLIPRVGNHYIHLGTTDNYRGKLRNLEAFYDQVLPEVGWNKYSLINLEYKDQIVCKRR